MNERIRQLAEQAGIELPDNVVDGVNGPGVVSEKDKLAKFAELIVGECGLWFNNRLVVNPDYGIEHRIERNRAVVRVMKEFNQHFGVEQ
jgi:hypothetical protein